MKDSSACHSVFTALLSLQEPGSSPLILVQRKCCRRLWPVAYGCIACAFSFALQQHWLWNTPESPFQDWSTANLRVPGFQMQVPRDAPCPRAAAPRREPMETPPQAQCGPGPMPFSSLSPQGLLLLQCPTPEFWTWMWGSGVDKGTGTGRGGPKRTISLLV